MKDYLDFIVSYNPNTKEIIRAKRGTSFSRNLDTSQVHELKIVADSKEEAIESARRIIGEVPND